MKNNTFGEYVFEDWVCDEVRKQIIDFWGCFGRTYKDWLDNSNHTYNQNKPKYGENVVVLRGNELIVGRYIHAWNNMGRVIKKDGSYRVVSTCDKFLDEKPTTMTYSMC